MRWAGEPKLSSALPAVALNPLDAGVDGRVSACVQACARAFVCVYVLARARVCVCVCVCVCVMRE